MGPIFTGYCVYRYKRPISSDFYIILDELRHAYREQDVASSYIYHKELGSRERVARLVCFSAGISSLHVYIAAARRVSWDITSLGLREDNRRDYCCLAEAAMVRNAVPNVIIVCLSEFGSGIECRRIGDFRSARSISASWR